MSRQRENKTEKFRKKKIRIHTKKKLDRNLIDN